MAKIKICGIYKIINLINGKIYIGSSIDIKKRWREHKNDLNRNEHENCYLQNAWNKYGEENFKFEIIEECTREEKDQKEQIYINESQCTDDNIGYNICKLVGTRMGVECKPETRQKISEAQKGEKSAWFGRKHTEEELLNMREGSKKGKRIVTEVQYIPITKTKRGHKGEKNPHAKLTETIVEQIRMKYEKGDVSMKQLSEEYGVAKGTIQDIINYRTWKLKNEN